MTRIVTLVILFMSLVLCLSQASESKDHEHEVKLSAPLTELTTFRLDIPSDPAHHRTKRNLIKLKKFIIGKALVFKKFALLGALIKLKKKPEKPKGGYGYGPSPPQPSYGPPPQPSYGPPPQPSYGPPPAPAYGPPQPPPATGYSG